LTTIGRVLVRSRLCPLDHITVVIVIGVTIQHVITDVNGIVQSFQVVVITHTQRAAVEVDVPIAVVESIAQIQTEAQAVQIELEVKVRARKVPLVEYWQVVQRL